REISYVSRQSKNFRFSAKQKFPVLISTKSSLNSCYDGELDYAFSMDDQVEECIFPFNLLNILYQRKKISPRMII
ncbi:MAG: hypothetical protein WBC20_00905, partial [Candidatus Aminicenantaceae bacterium]